MNLPPLYTGTITDTLLVTFPFFACLLEVVGFKLKKFNRVYLACRYDVFDPTIALVSCTGWNTILDHMKISFVQ